jgi:predicted ATPase/DNA-binding SARP family transcriptional activator
MSMLEVRLLGMFEVKHKKKQISISSRPAQSLFAYLVITAGTPHRREKLAGMLWPDSLEETARDNLRHALWRVRKALESGSSTRFLHADDLTIKFEASSGYWLDAAELEKLSENASADELSAVLSGYQGELLPGFYDEWVMLEREHLSSVFEHKMARLMSLLQNENRWLDILDWGERWIKLGQKPEPAYRALMLAHAAKGDMSNVAATYERCVKSLREFGMEPSVQTKELYKNLKSDKESPKTLTLTTRPVAKEISSNIPVPLTSFIGREKELKEIARLLSSSRLLTLTGPGGVGKTRLAIQTARYAIKKFKDGIFWVDLVGLQDSSLIPQKIAQELNVREVSNQPMIETLKTHLKSKDLLLVLDNCEHLIEACAQTVEGLLGACPKLKILATSRERLDLFNETAWNVPSLPLPEMQQAFSLKQLKEFASIGLFVERARNVKSDFLLTEQNASSVAQICDHLDGIPLAIELASARIKVLSVDEIASRLNDRFSLLTSGSRTALPRQQTLRATIDWSHELLTEPERILFHRLAVFVGGFTLEGAEGICSKGIKRGDILDLLGRLVDKSLVMVLESTRGDTRYRLLETIREYAFEKLTGSGEAATIRNQHLEFFMRLAEEASPNTFGAESVKYFEQIDRELDNIRSTMEWAIETRQALIALRLAAALFYFWYNRTLQGEWFDRFRRVLSLPEGLERTPERAKALSSLSFFYWAGMTTANPYRELEEALSIGRELGSDHIIAQSLRNLGRTEYVDGNYAKARSLLEESLDIGQKLGHEHKMEIVLTKNFLGDVAWHQGDLKNARLLYEECVSALKEIRDQNFLAYAVRRLGQVACRQGEFEKAALLCGESLSLNQGLRDERGIVACLSAFAGIATARGKSVSAAHIFGAVKSLLSALGIRLSPIDGTEYNRNVAALREKLDRVTLEKTWAKGATMTLEQAVTFALEETKI